MKRNTAKLTALIILSVLLSGCDLFRLIIPERDFRQTVSVSEGQVSPQTVVLSPSDSTKLTDSDGTGNSFRVSSSELPSLGLRVGSVFVSDATSAFPTGLLRKVTSISTSGDTAVIATAPAALDEAFDDLEVRVSYEMRPEDDQVSVTSYHSYDVVDRRYRNSFESRRVQNESNGVLSYVSDGQLVFDISDSKYRIGMIDIPVYEDGDDSVVLNGSLDLAVSFDVEMSILEQRVRVVATPSADLSMDVSANLSRTISENIELFTLKRRLFLPIGGVPFWITPTFTASISVDGSVDVAFDAGVTVGGSVDVGMEYAAGNWTPIADVTPILSYRYPTLSGALDVRASFDPQISVLIYDAVAPTIKLANYLRMTGSIDTSLFDLFFAEYDWDLYGGMNLTGSFALPILNFLLGDDYEVSFDLYDTERRLIGSLPAVSGISASDGDFGSHIRVEWSDVSDAVSYTVYRREAGGGDFSAIGESSDTLYDDNTPSAGVDYEYTVKAYDDSLGYGPPGSPDSGHLGSGNSAPTVSLLSPANDSISEPATDVTLRWSGSDADGDSLQYSVYFGTDSTPDSGELISTTSLTQYPIQQALQSGIWYYWQIRASDGKVGVPSESDVRRFQVGDSAAPNTQITSSPPDTTTSTSVSYSWTGNDNTTAESALVYSTYLEGHDSGWLSYSSATSRTIGPLSAGSYIFHVRARDEAGNIDPTPAQDSFSVVSQQDTTPPDTFITASPPVTTTSTTVSFSWSGSDNVTATEDLLYSTFLMGYDSGWSPFTSATSRTVEPLASGSYIFHVRAKDEAGNIDPTPAQENFSVIIQPDTVPPDTTIATAPPDGTTSTRLDFAWTGSDDRTATRDLAYSTYLVGHDSGWSAYSAMTSRTVDVTSGDSYVFKVRARDEAGNVDPSPAQASIHVASSFSFVDMTVTPNSKSLTTNSAGWSLSGVEVRAHFSDGSSMIYGNSYTWTQISGPGSFNAPTEYYTVDSAGTAVIRCALTIDGVTKYADYTITVGMTPSSITLDPSSTALTTASAGWSLSGVEVTAHFSDGSSTVYANGYTWTKISGPGSFNSSTEYYTVNGAGTAVIRCSLTVDGITKTADYTITVGKTLTSISLDPSSTALTTNSSGWSLSSVRVTAHFSDAPSMWYGNGYTWTKISGPGSFNSSTEYYTVNGAGTAVIRCSLTVDGITKTADYTITVGKTLTSISLDPSSTALTTNSSGWSLSGVEVTAHFSDAPAMIYGNGYTWTKVSGPGSFNSSTEYYTVNGAGTAVIRCSLTVDGITKTADYTITVGKTLTSISLDPSSTALTTNSSGWSLSGVRVTAHFSDAPSMWYGNGYTWTKISGPGSFNSSTEYYTVNGAGTAVIRCSLTVDGITKTADYTITVGKTLTSISLDPSSKALTANSSGWSLSGVEVTAHFSDAPAMIYGNGYTWTKVSGPGSFHSSTEYYTVNGAGTAVIRCSLTVDGITRAADYTITVGAATAVLHGQAYLGSVAIPDNTGWDGRAQWTMSLTGAPSGRSIVGVDIYYYITHTYIGDLVVYLTTERNGQWYDYDLSNRSGGSSDDIQETVNDISYWNGLDPNGIWYLVVYDDAAGDVGQIEEWEIWIEYQ